MIYTRLPAGGTYYPICMFATNSECLIGIYDAFYAFCLRVSVIFPTCPLYPQPKRAYSALHSQARTDIIIQVHACRHLTSAVPWISEDLLLTLASHHFQRFHTDTGECMLGSCVGNRLDLQTMRKEYFPLPPPCVCVYGGGGGGRGREGECVRACVCACVCVCVVTYAADKYKKTNHVFVYPPHLPNHFSCQLLWSS